MRTLLIILALAAGITTHPAADWPCWRGPDGLGVSSESNLPQRWSRTEHVPWKLALPGKGASSPIVVGDRVYVTTQTEDTALHVIAIERKTGRLIWKTEVGRGKLKAHNLHNMATPTPVSDGRHVWALFGTGDIACLDAEGRQLWHRNLVKEYGEYKTNHGYGSSPMLLDGTLYVTAMHQGPSYLLALDARTGANRWKKDRQLAAKEEAQDSYSSPIFIGRGDSRQLLLAGAEAITAYHPASGELLWTVDGLTVPHPYGRTIAGMAAGDGHVIAVASGFQNRGYTVAARTDGHGNVTASHKVWSQPRFAPDCPTPVVSGGWVFTIRDDGMASCLDLKTGEPRWQERLFTANVKVSPVVGDGKVYFLNGVGSCTVVQAGPRFEVLATNDLGEPTLSTPAISHGHLFLRTESSLFCIGD